MKSTPSSFPWEGWSKLLGVAASDLIETVRSTSVKELQQQADDLRAQLALVEAAITIRLGVDRANGTPNGEPAAPTSKRKAILRLLREDPEREWKLSNIRAELVTRGWLEDSGQASHSLGVTASKMYGRGELERPRAAHYRITAKGMTVTT